MGKLLMTSVRRTVTWRKTVRHASGIRRRLLTPTGPVSRTAQHRRRCGTTSTAVDGYEPGAAPDGAEERLRIEVPIVPTQPEVQATATCADLLTGGESLTDHDPDSAELAVRSRQSIVVEDNDIDDAGH